MITDASEVEGGGAVVAVQPPTQHADLVADTFPQVTGNHGGTVRPASTGMLAATFPRLPDALETAAELTLDPQTTGLRCGVVRLARWGDGGLRGAVAEAESLCRGASPGHIVVAAATPPRDDHSSSGLSLHIAGRERELERLQAALLDAEAGRARVLTLSGPLGSGRSTLLQHVTAQSRARGFAELAVGGTDTAGGGSGSSLRAARQVRAEASAPPFTPGPDLAHDLLAWTVATTEHQPLLLAVDDLDRVDGATRHAVRFLVGRLGAEKCLVVVTVPPEAEELLPGTELVRLGDLPGQALEAIIGQDGPIDVGVLRRCVTLAGGNPLAAREVSRSLSDRQRSGVDPLPPVPEPALAVLAGFRELLAAAPGSARRAAVVAAADDTGDAHVVREALVHLGEEPAGLEEAEVAGLLRLDDGVVRFAHPLLRPVAYHQVAPGSRRAAHRSLAAALSQPRQAAARAYQLAAAAVGADEPAALALQLVAEGEASQGDPLAAARTLARSAQLTAADDVRHRRYVDAAVLALRAGAPDLADSLLADAPGQPAGETAAVDELVARSLTELAHGGPARARRGLAHGTGGRSAAGLALDSFLAALAGDRSRPHAGSHRLAVAADALVGAGPAALLLDSAPATDDPLAALGECAAAAALTEAGWVAAARQVVDRLEAPGRSVDPVALRAVAGLLALETGRPLAALEGLEDVVPPGAAGTPGDCMRLLALARTLLHTSRLRDADECLQRATTIVDRLGLHLYAPEIDRLDGLLLHAQGRAEGADLLDRASRARPDRAAADHVLAVLERGGLPPPSSERRLRSLARSPDPRVVCGARRALAALGGDLDGLDELANRYDEAGLVLESLRTRGARVSTAARTGLPAAGMAHEVAELGRRHGLTCPGARYWGLGTTSDPMRDKLTRAEHRVALAVGAGASNKVAAQELFVSTKTVDYHLQNIYRKLGIRSRTELAVLLAGVRPDPQPEGSRS